MTVPFRTHHYDIESIIQKHKRWILKRLENAKIFCPPFEIKDGAKLPLLNTYYILSLIKIFSQKAFWNKKNHTLEIHIPEFSLNLIYSGIENFYCHMAKTYLQKRLPFWANKMNIENYQFRIKNQRSLWGSCSKKRNLNFNWRIMLLSLEAVDYLIIHELAHLHQMNHSSSFWELVENFCPNYKIYKAELKNKNSWLKFPEIQ